MRARHRERWALGYTGLGLVALFETWPELDLLLASLLYADAGTFPGADLLWVQVLYRGTPWVGRLAFLASAIVLLLAVGAGLIYLAGSGDGPRRCNW
jgi:hypothetical protein